MDRQALAAVHFSAPFFLRSHSLLEARRGSVRLAAAGLSIDSSDFDHPTVRDVTEISIHSV